MSDREFNEFLVRLNADVRDRAMGAIEGGEADFKENVFTEIITEFLADNGVTEGAEVCHYEGRVGRGIGKVNGYFLGDDSDRLEIFTSLFLDTDEIVTAPRDAVVNAVQRAERFVSASFEGLHQELEAASDPYAMAREINESSNRIDRIRIHLLSDGASTLKNLDATEVNGVPLSFEIWDVERLFRAMQAGLPRDEIVINFEQRFGDPLPCLPMPEPASDYMAYLAVIPGEILFSLYDEFGSRLLEFNVRSFLQARGKVNRGIRDSLKSEPDRFFAYNNGIVVTVDELELTMLDDGRPAIRSVSGMQIVNGGQTTASIHRAKKQDKTDISSVCVPAKITLIKSEHLEDVVHNISLYANTQNVIQMADFSANDPFHVAIENLSESIWCPGEQGRWFYERARGQYQVAQNRFGMTPARRRRFKEQTPPARKFTKTDLAKFLISWDQKPHQVSKGIQKNFVLFMQEYLPRKGKDWEPDETWYRQMIAQAILYKAIQRIVRQEKFPAFRANIVTYLTAYLSSRSGTNMDLEMIWSEQGLSSALEDLLRSWSHDVNKAITESAAGRNVTEWAKKEECWKVVWGLDLAVPDPLPVEMQEGAAAVGRKYEKDDKLTPEDYDNVARCKEVDGPTWLKIHAWGESTGHLKKWQYGIAHTLSGYAAGNWQRSPSPKQAKHGVHILQLASDHDAL